MSWCFRLLTALVVVIGERLKREPVGGFLYKGFFERREGNGLETASLL